MNWIGKNPFGAGLLGVCALLVLVGLGLTLWWGRPVSPDGASIASGSEPLPEVLTELEDLGPLRNYEVVNNRPLFNESRRPQVLEVEQVDAEPEVVVEQEVAAPPRVRLTGVVITPDQRVVTLTPEEGGEAVVIREGMPLDGEYVGWSVDRVRPRRVSLLSADGESIDFELTVHDAMIEEPPEPEPPRVAQAEVGDGGGDGENADGETRSRADEIRERIRQRREQLRQEAEEEAAEEEDARAFKQNAYQDAIRSMMSRSGSQDDDDEDSGDE